MTFSPSIRERERERERVNSATPLKFREFSIDTLFEVVGTKSLDEGKLTFIQNGINFVGRVSENNGIKGKIEKQKFIPNEANTITATVIGNYKYVKFQKEPYYCSQNINKLKPNFNINEKIAIFIMAYIQKFVSQYNGQQGGYKLEELKYHQIYLPIDKFEKPNFDFMENFIKAIQKLVIKDVVLWADKKINATKQVIRSA